MTIIENYVAANCLWWFKEIKQQNRSLIYILEESF